VSVQRYAVLSAGEETGPCARGTLVVLTNEMADQGCLLLVCWPGARRAGLPRQSPALVPGRGGAQRSRLDPVRLNSAAQ
jgi:hypothetical protein